jgi:CBS domain-containing protein
MRVADIMTSDPQHCPPETSLRDLAAMMAEQDCGVIPVTEPAGASSRLAGVVTDRDIVVRAIAAGRDPAEMTAGDCMTSPAATVAPESSLEDAIRLMEQKRVRRLPVVDDAGSLRGIVSQADIARHADASIIAEVVREVSRPGN